MQYLFAQRPQLGAGAGPGVAHAHGGDLGEEGQHRLDCGLCDGHDEGFACQLEQLLQLALAVDLPKEGWWTLPCARHPIQMLRLACDLACAVLVGAATAAWQGGQTK